MSERENVEVGVTAGGNPLSVHQWSPDCRNEGCHRAHVFTASELAAHDEAVRVSERVRLAEEELVLARPQRPHPPGTPLVAVSETYIEDAEEAMSDVPELQDSLANVTAYAEAMPARVADFLLTYSADGDTKDPWQAGHNYAMREAARMVRERWHEIETPFRLHYRGDGPNGETTTCECPIGADHDL